ncbi:Long-chain-fatty-acid--CoA ligase [uncultured Candidatus Thioglobus sp.]|nr:Long-chain-fatty-acid--CoA ligase [uncultured Candidatus Thioglobus sp.]
MKTHLTQLLNQAFNETPDNAAFSGLNHTMHYDTLYHNSLKVSHYLSNNTKTGTVAIMLPNLLTFPVVLFGAWYADKTVTLINPLYTSDELLKQCLDAQVSSIIIAKIFTKTLAEIIDKTQIKTVITVEVGDCQPKLKAYIINSLSHLKYKTKAINTNGTITHTNLSTILAQPQQNTAPNTFNNDIALLQYTGGTSGVFKAAILKHKNLFANIYQLEQWLPKDINSNSIILTALPLYHIFALTINCLLFIHIKGSSVLVLNPREIKQLIAPFKKYKINVITGVNTLFAVLIRHKNFKQLNTSSLKAVISGGMPLDKKLADKWQSIVGKPIVQGYGLTECSPVVSAENYDAEKFSGSVGKPLIDTEIKILDKSQQTLKTGEIGEIVIKGPQVMDNYWQKEKHKDKAFTEDGYFISGDMGYFDKDGRIFIVGRSKDMMIVSGFNVYPDEVEHVLNQHPDVIESACIGIKDDISGQSIKAFVVKKSKATLTTQTLIDHCKAHLTHYKIPKTIEWIDVLPKSNIGKILKRKLVD